MSTLAVGDSVGRYRIVRFLGEGAMGEVFLAQDPHIERPLAIKTVRLAGGRAQDIDERKKRLLREARAVGRLLHPNVVTLFDAGETEGLLYLAFEFVEGSDLAARLEAGDPPTLREVLGIVRQVADALDYAHRQGIVHRDVKPSNILLDTTGRVKVADFGIAKVTGQATELTVAGSVMGSPQYLSPEQIRGEELDGRTDVFSLGVVLYELLSGRRPFDGDTITTLVYQILNKEPAITDLRAVPLRLDQLLHRMMAKDRDDRLQTAGQVAEEVAAIERELPEAVLAAPAAMATQPLDETRLLPSRANTGTAFSAAAGTAGAPSTAGTRPATGATASPPPAASATGRGSTVVLPSSGSRPIPTASVPPMPTLLEVPGTQTAFPPRAVPQAQIAAARKSSAGLWIAILLVAFVLGGMVLAAGAYYWFVARPKALAAGTGGQNPVTDLFKGTIPETTTPQAASPGSPASSPSQTAGSEPTSSALSSPAIPGPAAPSTPASPPPATPTTQRPASGSPSTAVPSAPSANRTSEPPPYTPPSSAPGSGSTLRPGPVERPTSPSVAAVPPPEPPRSHVETPRELLERQRAEARQRAAADREEDESGEAAPDAAPAADQTIRTGLELAFRITPPDTYVLLDGTVIGRADEWSGQKGARSFTLPGPGSHLIKLRRSGMKDYRLAVEATATRGTTPVNVRMQPLPAAEVATSDLVEIKVREAIALQVQPADAVLFVDNASMGPVRQYAGRFGHAGEWLHLEPGRHRITLVAPGYKRRDLAVEVDSAADRTRQKIDVTLAPGRD